MESTQEWQEKLEQQMPTQVKEIRSIMEDKYGIVVPRNCDGFIIRCLRLKDGKQDKAVKLIKTFHSTIGDFDAWGAPLIPSLYLDFYDPTNGVLVPILKRDREGRRIFVIRAGKWDYQKMNFDQVLAAIWLMVQYVNGEYVDVQRNGYTSIWDFSNFTLNHAWAVKQWRIVTLMKWVQNSLAGRIKAFHMIFHPRVIAMLYQGVKPFLKEKLRKRIIFHGDNLESLHNHIDPECLPTYLGGAISPDDEGYSDTTISKGMYGTDAFFKDMMADGFPSK